MIKLRGAVNGYFSSRKHAQPRIHCSTLWGGLADGDSLHCFRAKGLNYRESLLLTGLVVALRR